jgi:hypothetical protein
MAFQLNNVLEYGSERVYDLLLDDEGLYVLHVGETDGGLNDYAGGHIRRFNMSNQETADWANQMAEGEEPLPNIALEDWLANEHSRYLSFHQMHSVDFFLNDEPRMHLKTNQGNFHFRFPNTSNELLKPFAAGLESGIELHRSFHER